MDNKIGYKLLGNQQDLEVAVFFSGKAFACDGLKNHNGEQYRPLQVARVALEKFARPTLSCEVISRFLDAEPDSNLV